MVRVLALLVSFIAICFGVLVLASFGAALHPVGDSLAVFRVPLAVIFALAVIWSTWSRYVRWPLAGCALLLLGWHGWMNWRPDPTVQADFTLYQQNMLYQRGQYTDFISKLRQVQPNFVTLQEVSQDNLVVLESLRDLYPHQVYCPFRVILGEAVLSRHPIVDQQTVCSGRDGVAAIKVDMPFGQMWVASIHLNWPWPYLQERQLTQLLPELRQLDGHVVLAGDFNSVAWSHTLDRVEAAIRAERVGRYAATYDLPWGPMSIGIDHVLTGPATGPQRIEIMPKLGSDHYGILAHLKEPAR